MAQTACWLARFHSAQQSRVRDSALSFLKRYDAEYYRGWAQRTFEYTRSFQTRFPWLAELNQCEDAWFAPLLAAAQTIIHGESYAKNVLVRGNSSFIVDWESAAVAAGEVDLAALTDGEGWTATVVRRCEEGYRSARWPEGVPARHEHTLAAARIYLQFRWLGERPDWTVREKTLWRFDHLHAAAEQAGLI
jgi:thiamine kinase-like enzyme